MTDRPIRQHVSQRKSRSPMTMLQRDNIRRGHLNRQRKLVDSCEMVPVAPFREQFLKLNRRGEMGLSDLCIYMGWVFRPSEEACKRERRRPGYVKPATSYANRVLGLRRRPGCPQEKEHVTYDVALKLCSALGMDPWEAGI